MLENTRNFPIFQLRVIRALNHYYKREVERHFHSYWIPRWTLRRDMTLGFPRSSDQITHVDRRAMAAASNAKQAKVICKVTSYDDIDPPHMYRLHFGISNLPCTDLGLLRDFMTGGTFEFYARWRYSHYIDFEYELPRGATLNDKMILCERILMRLHEGEGIAEKWTLDRPLDYLMVVNNVWGSINRLMRRYQAEFNRLSTEIGVREHILSLSRSAWQRDTS